VAAILGSARRQVNATARTIYVRGGLVQSGCAKMVPFRPEKLACYERVPEANSRNLVFGTISE
jgi:hypothetical protein